MGKFGPLCIAFILRLCNVNVFKEDNYTGCDPLLSSLIFTIALFIALTKIDLYPECFRKLRGFPNALWNFLIATIIMEYTMDYFWYPLEGNAITFINKIAQFEKEVVMQNGIMQILRTDAVATFTSYALSVFFLYCALHGTRLIDFRSKCGYSFVRWKDFRRIRHKLLKSLGIRRRHESRHKKRHADYNKCYEEDDGSTSDDDGDAP